MPLAYRYHEQTKKYIGEVKRQLDQLESHKAHTAIWLMPANSTDQVPPKEKKGYEIFWDEENKKWIQKKIETPKEEQTIQQEPTELEKAYLELYEAQAWLDAHDYIGNKIATGRATKKEYAKEIAQMNEYAEKINTLKAKIKELQEESNK